MNSGSAGMKQLEEQTSFPVPDDAQKVNRHSNSVASGSNNFYLMVGHNKKPPPTVGSGNPPNPGSRHRAVNLFTLFIVCSQSMWFTVRQS